MASCLNHSLLALCWEPEWRTAEWSFQSCCIIAQALTEHCWTLLLPLTATALLWAHPAPLWGLTHRPQDSAQASALLETPLCAGSYVRRTHFYSVMGVMQRCLKFLSLLLKHVLPMLCTKCGEKKPKSYSWLCPLTDPAKVVLHFLVFTFLTKDQDKHQTWY